VLLCLKNIEANQYHYISLKLIAVFARTGTLLASLLSPQDFNYQWLIDELKHNLPLELDFNHELQNANECRANLASNRSVHDTYVQNL
jgi:predicted unusual protein kinase regulating ubiquinone biosynthesis (AarF/ABC1/UbiB family)